MSERDRSQQGVPRSEADRTLLGVAPPRVEQSAESPLRSPVFVRSGTSVAEIEPPPLPSMALPNRPLPLGDAALGSSDAFAAHARDANEGALGRAKQVARAHPVTWMVAAPVLVAVGVVAGVLALSPKFPARPATIEAAASARVGDRPVAEPSVTTETPSGPSLAELEGKPLDSLSASELLRLSELRVERRRTSARALREKLRASPALATDKSNQVELLRLARDEETAREALAAMAESRSTIGADLLYEVWTGTPSRTEQTELSRALLYSKDVRSQASPALSVALELRAAQSCESYEAALPAALKDGDRRSLHLLTKLLGKRGCGPKKANDCYACLRDQGDELTATINAVKSRRPPSYPATPND